MRNKKELLVQGRQLCIPLFHRSIIPFHHSTFQRLLIIPRACARGKVIVVFVNKNIAKSGDLGTQARCWRNKSVEKVASVCLESSGTAYKRHK